MTTRRERRNLDAVYADLPSLECQGKCAESCGPIAMTRVEWERIAERVDVPPMEEGVLLGPEPGLTCPLLAGARCTVYDIRPTICRLWGIAEEMPCPWGCKPSRGLPRIEGYGFLARAEAAGA